MSQPRLLLAPETMDLAETTRALAVARALGDRADVTVAGYGGPFAQLVAEAGLTYRGLEPAYDAARLERLWRADRLESLRPPFSVDDIRVRVASELALLDELRPDLVFIGFTLTTYLSARIAQVPLVQLVPFAFTRPFVDAGLATWPDQLGFPGRELFPSSWLDRALGWWAGRTRLWMRGFQTVAAEYGTTLPSRLIDFWVADHNLVAELPEVTGVPELPGGREGRGSWEYVGPVFARLDGDIPASVAEIPSGEPWLYCAMGSSGEESVVRAVVTALGGLPYRVVAPVGALIRDPGFRPPDNVTVTGWLPAHRVNPLARLAVIHGGQGTVQTAVASGTPFVGIGMQPEQEWNIDFLVRAGSARRLSRRSITRESVHEAVLGLLADERACTVAARLRQRYAEVDGAAVTAERLLALARSTPRWSA